MDNGQLPTTTSQPKKPLLIVGAAIVAVAIVIVGVVLVKNATAQPARLDYQHLQNERNIADIAVGAYDPILEDFIARYNAAYKENYSADKKTEIKNQYDTTFNTEVKLGEDRLHAMNASVALKNSSVKSDYEQYARDYRALVDYMKQSKATATEVVEVITGVCRKVTQIKQSGDYAKRFVDDSQACMDRLAQAKNHVTPSAKTMMTKLEKMYKTRHDAFKKAVDEKNETAQIALKSVALFSILGINSELAKIQSEYSTAENKAYKDVQDAVEQSSDALKKALETQSEEK